MRVTLVQMRIETGSRSANLTRALRWIERAAEADPAPDLIVLPECCDFGWLADGLVGLAEPDGGTFVESLAAGARELGVWLAAGYTDRRDDCVFNAAALIDPDGDVVLRHRKINLIDVEQGSYAPGEELRTRRTPLGRLALTICADSWIPCITRTAAAMGAKVVVSPCAWACQRGREAANLKHIRSMYADRARESNVYLLGANAVGVVAQGPWKGRIVHGNSLVYGPGGAPLACGPTNEEGLIEADIVPAAISSGG